MSASSFLDKNLREGSAWIEHTLAAEVIATRKGLLQAVDPRVKLVSLLALLVFSLLSRNIWVIASVYGLSLLLAVASRISLIAFLRRVWLFVPIFTAAIAVPALFLTPGEQLASVGGIVITHQGVWGAIFLISRVATAVSISTLLILTTKWHRLLLALRALRVPSFIIIVLTMCYRYIFVLMRLFKDFLLARKSRVIGRVSWRDNVQFLARTAGIMLIRSLKLADDVYLAMIARGFDGEVELPARQPLRSVDYGWIALTFILLGALAWKG